MDIQFGSNVHKARLKKGISLQKLANLCGASRSMLGKIENNQSIPTVSLASRIARALDVTVSELLEEIHLENITVIRREERTIQLNPRCKIARELVMPFHPTDGIEIFSFSMPPQSTTGHLPPHKNGTYEHVFVTTGIINVLIKDVSHILKQGDSLRFAAHVWHEVINIGDGDAEFLVIEANIERQE